MHCVESKDVGFGAGLDALVSNSKKGGHAPGSHR